MSSLTPGGRAPEDLAPLGADECRVWWAMPSHRRVWHDSLLDDAERARHDRLRRADDRDRFVVAVALTRIALASHLGVTPRSVQIDRTCQRCGEAHGKPRLAGSRACVQWSISHSSDRVVVAMTARATAVGVDVEALAPPEDPEGLGRLVLSSPERAAFEGLAPRHRGDVLLRYWTRKEAVVKATGDGLNEPLTHVTVTAPDEHPRLLRWTTRPGIVPLVTMHDLQPGDGYVAALAVIGAPVVVREIDARHVLTAYGETPEL